MAVIVSGKSCMVESISETPPAGQTVRNEDERYRRGSPPASSGVKAGKAGRPGRSCSPSSPPVSSAAVPPPDAPPPDPDRPAPAHPSDDDLATEALADQIAADEAQEAERAGAGQRPAEWDGSAPAASSSERGPSKPALVAVALV